MLRVIDLHKRFQSKKVLRGVSMEIREGDRILLTGENGSGKTTLMRIVCAMIRPDRGEVEWKGSRVWDEPREHRIRFGVLMDEPFLMPEATLLENLTLFHRLGSTGGRDIQTLRSWIERFRLDGHGDALVRTLSKGERQKAGLIRALSLGSPVLLLDEPMTGLDTQSRIELGKILGDYKGTILFSSHESTDSWSWITRRMHLVNGTLGERHAH